MQSKNTLPVLKLDSLDPIQAYKSGVLLRRSSPDMSPSQYSHKVLLDLPCDISVEQWDPDVLLKHVDLARLEIAGVINNNWVSQLFAEVANLPLLDPSPSTAIADACDDARDLPIRPSAASALPASRPAPRLEDVMPASPASLAARLVSDIARLTARPDMDAATVGDAAAYSIPTAFENDEITVGALDQDIAPDAGVVNDSPEIPSSAFPDLELVPMEQAPQDDANDGEALSPVARETAQPPIDFSAPPASSSLQFQVDVRSPEGIDQAIAAIEVIVGRVSTLARPPAPDSQFAIPPPPVADALDAPAPAQIANAPDSTVQAFAPAVEEVVVDEVSALDLEPATGTVSGPPIATDTTEAVQAFTPDAEEVAVDEVSALDLEPAASVSAPPIAADTTEAVQAFTPDVEDAAVVDDLSPPDEAALADKAQATEATPSAVQAFVPAVKDAEMAEQAALAPEAAADTVSAPPASVDTTEDVQAFVAPPVQAFAEQARVSDDDVGCSAHAGSETLEAPEHTCNKCRDRALLSGEDLVVTEPAGEARTYRGRLRAGQVCENRTGDLVLVGTVGPGAVIRAAGSVHVYGRASGAIKAGQRGDATARIYVADFNAQIVDIAGRYQSFEVVPEDLKGKTVEIWLENEALLYQAI